MPTYPSSSLNGSGSLGTSAMTAGQTYTFELENTPTTIGSVAYFTLEANSTANQNLSSQTSCLGTFGGFLNSVDEGSLLENSFGFSISVSGDGGAFEFTPTTTIPANSYYLKTTGRIGLQLS
tara:strand:+ start:63 stop:428 length:366 start_codon:yes stop_codon:yes gene_type:complete